MNILDFVPPALREKAAEALAKGEKYIWQDAKGTWQATPTCVQRIG